MRLRRSKFGFASTRSVVVVLAVWCTAALGPACRRPRPGPCPEGHAEHRRGDRGILCRAEDGSKRALTIELHAQGGKKRQQCHYVDAKPDGAFEAWHANGQAFLSGRFTAGRIDGAWVQWDDTGRKVAQGEYREGRLVQGAPVAIAAVCPDLPKP